MIKNIIDGILGYANALKLIGKLRLWKFILWPGILSIFLGGGVLFLAMGLGSNLGDFANFYYPFEFGSTVVDKISSFIGGTLLVAGSLFIYKYLVMIIVAPFMGPLSERVEAHHLGTDYEPIPFNVLQMMKDILRSLYLALRNISRELFFILVLLILGLIPGVGLIVPAIIFAVQAYYAGFGNMDAVMERHLKKIRKRTGFVKRHKGIAIGNGIPFMLLLMVPFLGFFLAPALGVISGTTKTLKQLQLNNELRVLLPKEEIV